MSRGVIYTAYTTRGQKRIVLDLIRHADIGENQARSNFIADGLNNGYTLVTHEIRRTEVE